MLREQWEGGNSEYFLEEIYCAEVGFPAKQEWKQKCQIFDAGNIA